MPKKIELEFEDGKDHSALMDMAFADAGGGKTLETLISQIARHGSIAACGLADSAEVCTTVYPFMQAMALVNQRPQPADSAGSRMAS